jgi:hypothetical protein
VQYLYKYLFEGPAQKERLEMYSEQERESHDEIKLLIYGQVVCAMGAMWRFYGYQDYPASGVMRVYLDQKLLKSNKIKSFNR